MKSGGWNLAGAERRGCVCFRETPPPPFALPHTPKFTHVFHPHSAPDQETGAGTSSASSKWELLVNGSPEAPSHAGVANRTG